MLVSRGAYIRGAYIRYFTVCDEKLTIKQMTVNANMVVRYHSPIVSPPPDKIRPVVTGDCWGGSISLQICNKFGVGLGNL